MSKKSRIERLESFSDQKKEPKSKHVNIKTKKQSNKETKKQVYKRKTYFIPADLHNALKLIAVKENKNVSELVRTALKKLIDEKESKND